MGQHYQHDDLVFASEVGAPLRFNRITYHHFRPTLERAGLRQIRLYDLRHIWVTLSLLSGVSPKTVSEQAGHSSVRFTLDYYAHVVSSEREGASDRLENLLFAGVGNL
jgi:integrase